MKTSQTTFKEVNYTNTFGGRVSIFVDLSESDLIDCDHVGGRLGGAHMLLTELNYAHVGELGPYARGRTYITEFTSRQS